MLTWIILLLQFLVSTEANLFHTTSYNYETGIGSPQYMSQDQTKIVSYGTGSVTIFYIQIYSVNDKNMTLISQPYLKTCQNIRASANLQKLLCIDTTFTILRLYNISGYEVSFIQEITLGSALSSLFSVSFSFDGRVLVVSENTRSSAIVYKLNGGLYGLVGSYTLPSVHIVMVVSPDGQYIIYGESQSSGSMSLRIHQNTNTRPQVAIYTITTALPSSSFARISISNPQSGIYTILVIYSINSVYSIQYLQFNSNSNTLTYVQSLPLMGSAASYYLTLNGNFYAFPSSTSGSFYLYQKVAGSFTLVQEFSVIPIGAGSPLFFVSQDGGLIAMKSPAKMVFFFTCNVVNCTRCNWKDMCQTCTAGLVLVNNACVCPAYSTNVSNVCLPCALSNCQACSASNVCAVCTNGFTLTNTLNCACASGYNINQKTGRCVQCNVASCYRCDDDNICQVFSTDLETINNLKSMLIFITIILVLAIIIIIILTILYLKQKYQQKQQQQQQQKIKDCNSNNNKPNQPSSLSQQNKQKTNVRLGSNQSLQLNNMHCNNVDTLNLSKIKDINSEQEYNEIVQERGRDKKRKRISRKINENNMNINMNDINLAKQFDD